MSLRKMCALLAVLSFLTVFAGVWALVSSDKAADGNPAKLSELPDAALADGKPVTLSFQEVMPYVCCIAANEADETTHRYRYYPVQYRSNPARFVLICAPSEMFEKMERYVSGEEKLPMDLEGYLRSTEPRTQAALNELTAALQELSSEREISYADRFLHFYVEPATLRTSKLQRDIGWILIIGGLVMGSVGVIGFFVFRGSLEESFDEAPQESADDSMETSPDNKKTMR